MVLPLILLGIGVFFVVMMLLSGFILIKLVESIARVAPWIGLTVLALYVLKELLKKKK